MTLDLVTVFGAGLVTFATPCVLPLVPIYLAALVGGDISSLGKGQRGQLLARAALFALGFVLVFTLMGLGASSIGAFLADHRAAMQFGGAALVLLFALKFLGVIRVPFLDRVVKADEARVQTRFAGLNAFLMGIVFAAGWSPCVGPVLGSVLTFTASATAEPLVGAAYLALYGLGFAAPLLLTAAFAEGAVGLLRRVGPYLPRIEKGIGVLLLGLVVFLAHDAVAAWDEPAAAADEAPRTLQEIAGVSEEPEVMPMMVELFAEDCPICKRMDPLVSGIRERCDANGVRVRAVDISDDDNRHLAREFRAVGVPTFLFLDEYGEEVARLVGEQTEQTLLQALSALRGEECPGLALLRTEQIDDDKLTTLDFPEQRKEDVVSCPSTNTAASIATNASRSSEDPLTTTTFAAPAATESPGSCSQGSL